MNKKLMALGAGLAVVASVVAMAAYEAHVINVTAHIENALYVHPDELKFGTVFPQEYVEKQFTVELSSSFQEADRVNNVEYVIKQKPKCKCVFDPEKEPEDFEMYCNMEMYAPVNYATHECPMYYEEMESLCPFLSKMDGDPEDQNDTGVPSYYVEGEPDWCYDFAKDPRPLHANGILWKHDPADLSDLWVVDLKVPPVDGYVGQDWPGSCPTVPTNDVDYGCDLWVEVTNISWCGNGVVEAGEQCEVDSDCGDPLDWDCVNCVCRGPMI
jgi:hypothetical protein